MGSPARGRLVLRAEEKHVDVVEHIEHDEHQRRHDLAHESETLLEGWDDRAEEHGHRDAARDEHYRHTMQVARAIFRDDVRALEDATGFSPDEMLAFEFLRDAVRGTDPRRSKIIYAEDRKDLLEQALAVLYPTMAHGLEQEVEELREQHDDLVERVVGLRAHLADLEEAQDVVQHAEQAKAEGKGDEDEDEDEDDEDDAEAADGDAAKRAPIWTDPSEAAFELVLVAPGDRMIELVREVRDALGIGIRDAMRLCEDGGGVIALAADANEAAALKQRFEAAGATIEIRDAPAAEAPA